MDQTKPIAIILLDINVIRVLIMSVEMNKFLERGGRLVVCFVLVIKRSGIEGKGRGKKEAAINRACHIRIFSLSSTTSLLVFLTYHNSRQNPPSHVLRGHDTPSP